WAGKGRSATTISLWCPHLQALIQAIWIEIDKKTPHLTSFPTRVSGDGFGQPSSILALVQPSGGMAFMHRKAPFRCLDVMPHEGGTRVRILPCCPSLDRGSREAEAGFEPRTCRSVNSRCTNLVHLAWNEPYYMCLSARASLEELNRNHMFRVSRPSAKLGESFSCTTLSAPRCHATRKYEGWDTTRLPKPRQGKSRGRGQVRTTELPVKMADIRCRNAHQDLERGNASETRQTWTTATPPEGSTRAGILPVRPGLDMGSREVEVGFEPRTFFHKLLWYACWAYYLLKCAVSPKGGFETQVRFMLASGCEPLAIQKTLQLVPSRLCGLFGNVCESYVHASIITGCSLYLLMPQQTVALAHSETVFTVLLTPCCGRLRAQILLRLPDMNAQMSRESSWRATQRQVSKQVSNKVAYSFFVFFYFRH
ncbi:hypothetical protein T265_15357, partial [Opisthorchis viverrini]